MKKKLISAVVSLSILTSSTVGSIGTDDEIFKDVDKDDWYCTSVQELYNNNILPENGMFFGDSPASRGDIVLYMYNLYKRLGGSDTTAQVPVFEDVKSDSKYFDAVNWAYTNKIANGVSESEFNPDGQCLREQICAMVMRYFDAFGIKPKLTGDDVQFIDSLSVSDYARSYVAAAKLSGIIGGNENGYFLPQDAVTRAETAAIVYTMMNTAVNRPAEGELTVETGEGAYDCLYDWYKTEYELTFNALVPESAPVGVEYFNDAAIIGDSVSLSLQYYCAASKALGNAVFLCAGSLSPVNALWEVSSKSIHPVYNGQKMKVEDAVAASGVNKVYIMLGINSLSNGVDNCISNLTTLISRILAKSPNVRIILQSVTPMTATSSIITNSLNNNVINQYNARLLELCQNNKWYYLNVAEKFKDGNGNLIGSYCSDASVMGIHFTFEADKIWADYLKTHVPQELKQI